MGRRGEARASALAAVNAGTAFADPLHVDVLRDLVVLHYVRSLHYRTCIPRGRAGPHELVAKVITLSGALRLEALRETGLYLPGPASLGAFAERLIERSTVMRDLENGKLFRTSIEDTFHKMRDLASTRRWRYHARDGEFLIGDNPALTLLWRQAVSIKAWLSGMPRPSSFPSAQTHAGLWAPNDVMVRSPDPRRSLNGVQVHAADRYVYMRPGSGLEPLVERAAQRRPAGDRTT